MKRYGALFFFLISILASPVANADLAKAGNEVKETAVEVAKKTAEVGREVGHATAETAKSVGHAVADGARKVYKTTREAVSDTDSSRPNKPAE